MDDERQAIIRCLGEPRVNLTLEDCTKFKRPMKSVTASIECRQRGNELFTKKAHNSQVHEKIWKFYSQSIANAPSASKELAFAYGNRSALLLHLQKFQESISDIDRALAITAPSDLLRQKLLNRKAQCMAALAEIEFANTKQSSSNDGKNQNEVLNDIGNKTKVPNNSFNFSEHVEEDKAKIQEILSKKKAADPYDSVSIQHNEKYGRHLIANRYIKPGEIIMVVKPYIRSLNLNNTHAFCGHCLKTSWANIPCDYCNWCMFCSEECKREAWQQYHDIECPVIPYIMFEKLADCWKQLAIRSTVIAIREAGGISKLKEELNLVDSCNSQLHKGFLNGTFYNNRFQSVYSLSNNISPDALNAHIDQALLSLIALAKMTTLFGKGVKFINSKDLLSNEDVIFIGSLLLKLLKICDINSHSVMEASSCRFSKNVYECMNDSCCERGVCIAPIPSILNHSCDPNLRKCFTEDMDIILYAVQPIKKNTQLFDSYLASYFQAPLSQRQLSMKGFNFTCDCLPCKEKWPTFESEYVETEQFAEEENVDFKQKLGDMRELMSKLSHNASDVQIDHCLSTLDCLSEDIEKATSRLMQPSFVIASLTAALWTVFDYVYGMKLLVPDKC